MHGRRGRLTQAFTASAMVGAVALLAVFTRFFDPKAEQWRIDAAYFAAVVWWLAGMRAWAGSWLPVRPRLRDAWLPALLLAIFAAYWLPFYDNWRWAYTGDSLAWFTSARGAARFGMHQNFLTLAGVDRHFTYPHTLAFNALMFVFEPTLWWHRVGKLLVSCGSLAAIYTYFALTLGRWWAAALLVATASNYIWLWFSYVSYGHIDSHIFYFLTVTLATLILRTPDHLGPWTLCGLVGGLSLFFTQTAWSAVAAAGIVLGVYALVTRRVGALAIYAATFLLAASPVLLQFEELLRMTTKQTVSIYTPAYLQRIFTTILWLPVQSPDRTGGVYGAFLRWPLGPLYQIGAPLAVLGLLPPLRRWLRLPSNAGVLVLLLLWDAALMTLTNGGYGTPSSKRTYSLIPLQIFFALLPAYLVWAWLGRWKWVRAVLVGVILSGVATYAGANLLLIAKPSPGLYGTNVYDGLIEVRQRYAAQRVLFLTTDPVHMENLSPTGLFQELYRVADQLTLADQFDDETVVWGCAERLLICYEPNRDGLRFHPLKLRFDAALRPLPLLNTNQLHCFECLAAQPLARAGA